MPLRPFESRVLSGLCLWRKYLLFTHTATSKSWSPNQSLLFSHIQFSRALVIEQKFVAQSMAVCTVGFFLWCTATPFTEGTQPDRVVCFRLVTSVCVLPVPFFYVFHWFKSFCFTCLAPDAVSMPTFRDTWTDTSFASTRVPSNLTTSANVPLLSQATSNPFSSGEQ